MAEQVDKVIALTAGLNILSSLLHTANTNMPDALAELDITVTAGGPVAYGNSVMAAITDGKPMVIGDSKHEQGHPADPIDATKKGLFATNTGDQVYIQARALSGG